MKKLYFLLFIGLITFNSYSQVVISQVYGGGGNSGAVYNNDFIELFNRGTVAQSLNGWSVQYASANGTTWFVTRLPDVTLQPGKYYLIQQASGANTPAPLPTPDLNALTCDCTYNTSTPPAITTSGIAMAGTNGKVILSNSIVAETTANPSGAQIIDKVAYGNTSTSGFEGSGPTGTALSNSTAALRNSGGCTDTDNNANDFSTGTPTPRNSATAANSCITAGVNQNNIAGLSIYPNPVTGGKLFIDTNANASKDVTVFDVLGKQVLKTTITENVVNVGNLKNGIYIVKITEEGKTATRKLVIK